MPPPPPAYVSQLFEVVVPMLGKDARFHVSVAHVLLVFVRGANVQNTSWWRRAQNRLVNMIVPGYVHVELAFELVVRDGARAGSHIYMKCGIVSGERLTMEVKQYDVSFYEMSRLRVDAPWLRDRLFAQCRADFARAPAFNARGFWLNFVVPRWLQVDYGGERVFCSEYVVRALRDAGVDDVEGLPAYATTPQMLHDSLRARDCFVGVVGNMYTQIRV